MDFKGLVRANLYSIILFLFGYWLGGNQNEAEINHGKTVLEAKEIFSYRMCMQDKSCRMFVEEK